MDLSTEQFESLQELTKVQTQIATIRAEILAEQSTLEQYKLGKQKEAQEIVASVLTASKEALVEAEKNRDAIASLLAVAGQCAEEIKLSHEELQDLVQFHATNFDQTVAFLNEKGENIKVAYQELKRERETLRGEERNLVARKAELEKERIYVADRKEMLVKELNRIKLKVK